MEAKSKSIEISGGFALLVAAIGLSAFFIFDRHMKPDERPPALGAKIVGPETITHPGQFARYRVTVPGKDPKSLVYGFTVESHDHAAISEDMFELTEHPGEIDFATVKGSWRIYCSVTDPWAKQTQLLLHDVDVPEGTSKLPDKPPPDSKPADVVIPDKTPPPPPGKFDAFTNDVRSWLQEVKSPDKAAEQKTMADGAAAIAARCRSGDLAKHTGVYLESTVLLAVREANVKALGAHATEWRQFGNKVQTFVGQVVSAKHLSTAGDYADLLDAFVAGLR